jgi:hypothetical protein
MAKRKDIQSLSGGGGVFNDLSNYFKLVFRLMTDRRVSPFLKILPVGTLVYFIVPDLVPGPIDDAVIIWMGTYLFIELCPPEVVAEHRAALDNIVPSTARDPKPDDEQEEVIEGEFHEVDHK